MLSFHPPMAKSRSRHRVSLQGAAFSKLFRFKAADVITICNSDQCRRIPQSAPASEDSGRFLEALASGVADSLEMTFANGRSRHASKPEGWRGTNAIQNLVIANDLLLDLCIEMSC